MLLAVITEQDLLAVGERREVHGAAPDAHERRERLVRVVVPEIHAAVIMDEQELAAILEVRVLDEDERIAEVRELREQALFDVLELARVDLEALVAVRPAEAEELVLEREVLGQKLVDERHVVVERA